MFVMDEFARSVRWCGRTVGTYATTCNNLTVVYGEWPVESFGNGNNPIYIATFTCNQR
jgi:hypothetical protein